MARLEGIQAETHRRGLTPHGLTTVKHVEWSGGSCLEVFYLDDRGSRQHAIRYGDDEARLILEGKSRSWSFDAYGDPVRLVSDTCGIRLAWLFDPHLGRHYAADSPARTVREIVPRAAGFNQVVRETLTDHESTIPRIERPCIEDACTYVPRSPHSSGNLDGRGATLHVDSSTAMMGGRMPAGEASEESR